MRAQSRASEVSPEGIWTLDCIARMKAIATLQDLPELEDENSSRKKSEGIYGSPLFFRLPLYEIS